jgi:leucyl/phenylalanyl-tRNA--protein transferase
MFHRRTDASKVALVALVALLAEDGRARLVDVQWPTEHLASLGVVAVPRPRYVECLRDAIGMPLPAVWS